MYSPARISAITIVKIVNFEIFSIEHITNISDYILFDKIIHLNTFILCLKSTFIILKYYQFFFSKRRNTLAHIFSSLYRLKLYNFN